MQVGNGTSEIQTLEFFSQIQNNFVLKFDGASTCNLIKVCLSSQLTFFF